MGNLQLSLQPCQQPVDGFLYRLFVAVKEMGDLLSTDLILGVVIVAAAAVAIFMVNGRQSSLDTELRDGDRVGLFPLIGGG